MRSFVQRALAGTALAIAASLTPLVAAAPTASAVPLDEVFTPFILDTIEQGRIAPPEEWNPLLPLDDPFYRVPELPADTPPGTLLKIRPSTVQVYTMQPAHVRSWQMIYTSTDLDGRPRAVSGLLMIPDDGRANDERKLIGYVEANDSLAGACNPSTQWTGNDQFDPSLFSALGPVAMMFERGWAVMMPDFVNDGERGPHPFSVARLSGPATLDGLRAAKQVRDAGLSRNPEIGLFGIAGGGVGAGHAAEMQPTYAPELNIEATVLQAMVIDAATFERTASGGIGSGYVFANALGYATGYPDEIDLDRELTPLGKQVADVYQRSCQMMYTTAPFVPLEAYFTRGLPANNPAFERAYRENRLGQRIPASKVLISSCRDDFLVPFEQAEALGRFYRDGGAYVDVIPSKCAILDYVTDLYGTGTEMLGMQDVAWLERELEN